MARIFSAEFQAVRAIENGPCLCGATSHKACKTRETCDPLEEKAMAAHRNAALAARKELGEIAHFLGLYEQIGREIDLRIRQAAHLTDLKAKLARIIEKGRARENWREDLDDWVKESQEAQASAIRACVTLLIGPLGPIEQSIKTHSDAAEKFAKAFEDNLPRLAKAAQACRAATSGQAGAAVNEWSRINTIEQLLSRNLAGEKDALKLLQWTKDLAEKIVLAAELLDKGSKVVDASQRHALGAALEAAQTAVRELLLNYFADKSSILLSETPYARYAAGFQLARWGADYIFEGFRFYTAWNHIDDILKDITRDEAVFKKLGDQLVAAQDRLNALRAQSKALDEARGTSSGRMERALLEARNHS